MYMMASASVGYFWCYILPMFEFSCGGLVFLQAYTVDICLVTSNWGKVVKDISLSSYLVHVYTKPLHHGLE